MKNDRIYANRKKWLSSGKNRGIYLECGGRIGLDGIGLLKTALLTTRFKRRGIRSPCAVHNYAPI
jgi:hypothetical protein